MDPEDNEDRESHVDPEEGEYSGRTPDGNWGTDNMASNTSGETSSRSNGMSRPSTAPGNRHNYRNQFRRRKRPSGSSGSSSQSSSSSENSDNDGDRPKRMDDDADNDADNEAENEELDITRMMAGRLSLNSSDRSRLPPIPGNSRPWRRMNRESALHNRGRGQSLDPARFRSDMEGKISRSRSPVRSRSLGDSSERSHSGKRTKPFQRDQGWGSGVGMDEAYPHRDIVDERLSNHLSYAEDLTHIPTPDHRRVLHRSRIGGHHPCRSNPSRPRSRLSYGPLQSIPGSPSTSGDSFDMSAFRDALEPDPRPPKSKFRNRFGGDTRDLSPLFEPSRGDIIILQPPQRRRKVNNFHPSCVRTFSERFGFGPTGDLVVRIGTFAHTEDGEPVAYIPYKELGLYRRQDGVWKFLGDAYTDEDLASKRRMSRFVTPPFRGRSGQNCNIVPNWGDFIIRQDSIRLSELEGDQITPVIDWWTPDLSEEVNRVYPHNTILLRPYVRNPDLLETRASWLGKNVIRWDPWRGEQEGYISQVYPESKVYNGRPHEVLGPDYVAVSIINPPGVMEEVTQVWPLRRTFLLNRTDSPLYDNLSDEEKEMWNVEPWGSIEMYIYFAGIPPANGWIFWGSSRHIFDTPFPYIPRVHLG